MNANTFIGLSLIAFLVVIAACMALSMAGNLVQIIHDLTIIVH